MLFWNYLPLVQLSVFCQTLAFFMLSFSYSFLIADGCFQFSIMVFDIVFDFLFIVIDRSTYPLLLMLESTYIISLRFYFSRFVTHHLSSYFQFLIEFPLLEYSSFEVFAFNSVFLGPALCFPSTFSVFGSEVCRSSSAPIDAWLSCHNESPCFQIGEEFLLQFYYPCVSFHVVRANDVSVILLLLTEVIRDNIC